MAHLYERYMTNTKEVEVTDRLIEGLLLTMIEEGPKAVKDSNDYNSRANIMWAGMMAHNNSCGVGRTQDWSSHTIEHELSAQYDCAHGAGLAVIMPACLSYNVKHDVARFARVAVNVWGCKMNEDNPEITAREGIERFKQFLHEIGMPTSFAELGAKEEDIEKMAEVACYGDGRDGYVYGFVNLNKEDVINVYKLAL